MEELMRESSLEESHSPKRGRDDDLIITSHLLKSTPQAKRLRKAKTHPPIEKDRTRGRYACLGHRMKHKRCPLDCPERRPKPNQEQEGADTPTPIVKKEPVISKPRVLKNSSNTSNNTSVTAKKNVLQLEECTIGNHGHQLRMSRDSPLSSAPLSDRDTANWDSFEWEGLSWDSEHPEHFLKENESWMDLKSSSHWEESKSKDNLTLEIDCKQADDITKFEEEDIIESWLNDDGFGNATAQADLSDNSEGNTSENSLEIRGAVQYSNLDEVMRVIPNIILTRDMLERWLNEPYFNRLIQGCFVRVKVGESYLENPVYRIAHIDEVQDCWSTKGQTNKGLSLQIGANASKKIFPIAAISNQPPTDTDFRTWQEEMEKTNFCLDPSEVLQKQEIVRVLHIKYPSSFHTSHDIESW